MLAVLSGAILDRNGHSWHNSAVVGRAERVRSAQDIRRRLAPLLQGRRTFGHHDWLVIGEFPDDKAAASAVLAAAAGGSLSDVETTVAMVFAFGINSCRSAALILLK